MNGFKNLSKQIIMSLQEEIQSILQSSLSYEEKGEKLAKIVTRQEFEALLPNGKGAVALKEPLKPKATGMRVLHLSIHKVYFDEIILGTKPIEFRDWTNDYYVRKCSYEENGKRYLVPFDAIVLHVGRGQGAPTATVALKDITCDGTNLMFWVGKVLWSNSPLWRKKG